MISDFFETNNYFVDKKNGFQESCHIYNEKKERIGRIKQKLSFIQKVLPTAFVKSILPFNIEIRSANGGLEATISRRGSFLKSEIVIQDASGKKIGFINPNSSFSKPVFEILNTSNHVIAEICDVWKKSNFIINDSSENQIGSIENKWSGKMKNAAISASGYTVNVMATYSNPEEKTAILSSAIVLNMCFLN
ncbi:phospholipid scramblase-related protein [Flavobacterium sp. KACC 22761]|uniref:phospholipid scramblase-related protein n=1 Tax=Flavobacterium sp. KACC 22761 TaxID=3092665 RepID=UPI002A7487D9|nr:phospholipid scramblase-related protein [Flavobacterium sp. KACC 22761]WPO77827.1 phospholipid scramblase-related protein [Flavobacterium sp. KACC 22761]